MSRTKDHASGTKKHQSKKAANKDKKVTVDAPPAELLDLVENFLEANQFDGALAAFKEQRSKNGWKGATTKGQKDAQQTLLEIFEKNNTLKAQGASSAGGADDETDSSSDDSSSDDDSDVEMKDVETPAKKGVSASSDSSDSSESESESEDAGAATAKKNATDSSESYDSDSSSDDEAPAKLGLGATVPTDNLLKRKAASESESDSDSDDSSDESSSEDEKPQVKKQKVEPDSSDESSSDSDSDEEPATEKKDATKVDDSSDDSSDDDSDSSSEASSSSESESDESDDEANLEKAANTKLPESGPSSDSDSDSESEEDEPAQKNPSSAPVKNGSDSSVTLGKTSPELFPPLPPDPTTKQNNRGKKNGDGVHARPQNVPFSRVPRDITVDDKFKSNRFEDNAHGWGARAHDDLIVTKGKGFTKEKNKKKRGSYRGGAIDTNARNGIKFDD